MKRPKNRKVATVLIIFLVTILATFSFAFPITSKTKPDNYVCTAAYGHAPRNIIVKFHVLKGQLSEYQGSTSNLVTNACGVTKYKLYL